MHIPPVERYQRYCDDNKLDPFLQFDSSGFPIVLVAQGTKRGMRSSPGKLQTITQSVNLLIHSRRAGSKQR